MGKNISINVRVNSEVKEQAEQILASMGLTLSETFNMLLHQINLKKAVPFKLDSKYDYTMEDLKLEVREHMERYAAGKEKTHGPYKNLDELWDSMDI